MTSSSMGAQRFSTGGYGIFHPLYGVVPRCARKNRIRTEIKSRSAEGKKSRPPTSCYLQGFELLKRLLAVATVGDRAAERRAEGRFERGMARAAVRALGRLDQRDDRISDRA